LRAVRSSWMNPIIRIGQLHFQLQPQPRRQQPVRRHHHGPPEGAWASRAGISSCRATGVCEPGEVLVFPDRGCSSPGRGAYISGAGACLAGRIPHLGRGEPRLDRAEDDVSRPRDPSQPSCMSRRWRPDRRRSERPAGTAASTDAHPPGVILPPIGVMAPPARHVKRPDRTAGSLARKVSPVRNFIPGGPKHHPSAEQTTPEEKDGSHAASQLRSEGSPCPPRPPRPP
jgi:hypothetical protein